MDSFSGRVSRLPKRRIGRVCVPRLRLGGAYLGELSGSVLHVDCLPWTCSVVDEQASTGQEVDTHHRPAGNG